MRRRTKAPAWLDERVPAERSALLRYRGLLGAPADGVAEASLGAEGLSVRELGTYKGVSLCLLDLSSHSYTGTVKALSAGLIAAGCARRGERSVMILSSGNKANSLRAYLGRLGISVVSLVPSAEKLRGVPRKGTGRDVVALCEARTDEEMKAFGRRVAKLMGIPCQPVLADYAAADRVRAGAYAESLMRGAAPCTHFFQPVSSNYGLYGTYLGLEALKLHAPVPVGVQQEAIAPLRDVFELGRSPERAFRDAGAGYRRRAVFERTLFTTSPATLAENRWLKSRFGARFLAMGAVEFRTRYGEAQSMLADSGIELPLDPAALPEKSGALGLCAALRAASNGWLPSGSRVMVHFTGGVETLPAWKPGPLTVELSCRAGSERKAAERLLAALG